MERNLRIGCLLTFAQVLLPMIRRQFEHEHLNADVRQIEADRLTLINKLRRSDIELALSYDLQIPPDLRFIPLRSLQPYGMVGANTPLAARKSISVE